MQVGMDSFCDWIRVTMKIVYPEKTSNCFCSGSKNIECFCAIITNVVREVPS